MGQSLAKVSREEADYLGRKFVGDGFSLNEKTGFLMSKDGTRLYRPASPKPGSPFSDTGVQANFVVREYVFNDLKSKWQWNHVLNGHVDILP
jgi:filamentous hemagglutinin